MHGLMTISDFLQKYKMVIMYLNFWPIIYYYDNVFHLSPCPDELYTSLKHTISHCVFYVFSQDSHYVSVFMQWKMHSARFLSCC